MFGAQRRIAYKIFLGYLPPLAIMLLLGVVLPFAISSYLGRAIKSYEGTVRLVDEAYNLRRAAGDSENHLRGFILYNDDAFRSQFSGARDLYRDRHRSFVNYVEEQRDRSLLPYLEIANDMYREWLRLSAYPAFESQALARAQRGPGPVGPVRQAATRSAAGFEKVQRALDRLVNATVVYRDRQLARARTTERLRSFLTLGGPLFAALWAILIGRSIAIGITRPIEELTRAAEELGQGDGTRLLIEDHDFGRDEIGELGRSFTRMARTIGQREAVLRAQNEALSAIGRRIEAVLNSTNDGIVMLDDGGGFSVVNERFAHLFGIEPDVLLDQTFAQAGPLLMARFRNKTTVRARFREILSDPEAVADDTFEITEPVARTLRVYSAPVRRERPDEAGNTELLGRIFVFRDVTRETTVDRMKTEFVSTVSHELRTPLTAIRGYVDLMAAGKAGPLTDVQREFMGLVQASTGRLSALINDMLDISRIESGRTEVRQESVEMVYLVREAMQMLANQAATKQVQFHLSLPEENGGAIPLVRGDTDRITQVLVNLLSNGIKYTPSGGNVTVSVTAEGGVVTTCVADTGIGISPDDQKRLFQKFFRADNSTTREVGGTGLGLAITKAILEKMHGTIWVESALGQGSRFYFTLPIAETNPVGDDDSPERNLPLPLPIGVPSGPTITVPILPPALETPSAASGASRGLVLLIDEEPALLHQLSQQFRNYNFITSGATTGAEALRRARSLRPDAIALNLASSRLDTFAVLHALRTDPGTRSTPLALLSLRRGGGHAEARGPVGLLGLPLDRTEIHATLDAVFPPASDAPPASSRSKHLALVVGGDELVQALQDAATSAELGGRLRIADASAPETVEGMLGAPTLQRPDLIVVDLSHVASGKIETTEEGGEEGGGTAAALSETLRTYLSRGHGIPLLLVAPEALWQGVRSLMPPGPVHTPPERIAEQVGILLTAHEQKPADRDTAAPLAPAGNR